MRNRRPHPQRHLAGYAGILQADAYAGFNEQYSPGRKPGPITEAACWAHGRRKLFKLVEVARAPLAAEAVRRIRGASVLRSYGQKHGKFIQGDSPARAVGNRKLHRMLTELATDGAQKP